MGRERGIAVWGAWPIVGLAVIVAAAWMAAAGLSLQWRSAIVSALLCLGLEGAAAFYRSKRPDPRIAAALTVTAQLTAFSTTAACLSYAVAATGGGCGTVPSWLGIGR